MSKFKKTDEEDLLKLRKELALEREEKLRLLNELATAHKELAFQKEEKGKRAAELGIANKELVFQDGEKEKRAEELSIANKELVFQDEEKGKRAEELGIANKELAFQDEEKGKRAEELSIANIELVFQNKEKEKRAQELGIANEELAFQNKEKEKRAEELGVANKELLFQNKEKEKRAEELGVANKELAFQNEEKGKRADELGIANKELAFQNEEKEKRAQELGVANKELAFQNEEKEKRAEELGIANKELAFQNEEKEKRAQELGVANKELAFQNEEKEKRAEELGVANKELAFQNEEKEKRAEELGVANKELAFQNEEKEKRAEELGVANKELAFQNQEKEKRAEELGIANEELAFQNKEKEKRAEELGIANKELAFQNEEKEKRAAELLIANYARSLIEASLDPLVTISVEGKITDVNEASAKVTGISRGNLIGTDFSNYFTEPAKASEGYKQVFEKGFVADYPLTIHHKNGKLTDVLYNASVYKDDKGNVLGVFAAARDITAQKKYAEELTIKNEELEKAKELAETLANVKDQFLANMSHEIRTPLNGIIGFTKLLLQSTINDKQRKQLDAVKTSSDILLVLINDILDLAKIEAGKMSIEQTELKLSDLINTVLGTFELRFKEKELVVKKQFDERIPNILLGDPVRISQLLLNIFSNAMKFTNKGGKITIAANLLQQTEETARIEFIISDTGIGIPAEKLETIFEPFTQSSGDTARKYGGTGLGLSIVKQLVELMGGTITLKSKVDEGTDIIFVLPLMKTTATEISREKDAILHSEDLKKAGPLRILLAEDIPINQLLAQTILHDAGFEVDTAENGKIAIELLKINTYDIILMDLMMPEMGGFEASQYIRNNMQPPKSTVPIIALTADVTKSDVDKCKTVGMNDYVSKPFNQIDLLNKIAHHIIKSKEAGGPHTDIKKNDAAKTEEILNAKNKAEKIINLDYLKSQSPNNPKFLSQMIDLFLQQIPGYLAEIKKGIEAHDWDKVHGNTHKIKPSISFLGLPAEISEAAKQMDDYAAAQEHLDLIPDLFLKIETVFLQAFEELKEEMKISS